MSGNEGYADMLDELRAKATMPEESMILSDTGNGTKRVRSKHGAAIILPTAAERKAMAAQSYKEEQVQAAEELPKKRGRKAKQAEPVQSPQPSYVKVTVTENGNINIPTQYAHVYTGEGVLVLGLVEDLSYVPRNAARKDSGELDNIVTVSNVPGSYLYINNNYVDDQGIKNIILFKIGE